MSPSTLQSSKELDESLVHFLYCQYFLAIIEVGYFELGCLIIRMIDCGLVGFNIAHCWN
jgi:hypothetical protein